MTNQNNTTLLVMNDGRILDQGPFTMADDTIASANGIHPKHVLPHGWSIVDVPALPEDFAFGRYLWQDGALQALPDDPPATVEATPQESAQ